MTNIDNIRGILENSLSTNNELRNSAEKKLNEIVIREESMRALYDYCIDLNNNRGTRQMAMICFARGLKMNYNQYANSEWLGCLISGLLESFNRNIDDAYDFYTRILQLLFQKNNMYIGILEKQIIEFLYSGDRHRIFVGLISLESYLRRHRKILEKFEYKIIYEEISKFIELCTSAVNCGDWQLVHRWIKVINNLHGSSYIEHSHERSYRKGWEKLPEEYIYIAFALVETIGDLQDQEFIKTQKYAVQFICDYSLCIKDMTNNSNILIWTRIVRTLHGIIRYYLQKDQEITRNSRKIIECIAEFFEKLAEKRQYRNLIAEQRQWLLYELILPIHIYNKTIEELFEYNSTEYLDGRYNNDCDDLKSITSRLFNELLHTDHIIRNELIRSLIELLESGRGALEYKNYRYGIIGLLAIVQDSVMKVLGIEDFSKFIMKEIFNDIVSSDTFLISQSLYFLSFINFTNIKLNCEEYFNCIIRMASINFNSNSNSYNNSPIYVEAALALNYFLMNEIELIRPIVGNLFMILAELTRNYFLDGLRQLMDTLTDKFPDEVLLVTPQLTERICAGLLPALSKYTNDDSCDIICGYLNTLDQLILNAEGQKSAIQKIYIYIHDIITIIFDRGLINIYQEALGIFNSVLFILQYVDDPMLNLFEHILSSDPIELGYLPSEIKDLFDNFLSYGHDFVLRPKIINLLNRFLFEGLITSDMISLDVFYEDILEAFCRIIDSLITNTNVTKFIELYPDIFQRFIFQLYRIYEIVKSDEILSLMIFITLMNCFSAAFNETFTVIGIHFTNLFNDIYSHLKYFKRVYDKKVLLIFLGSLFRQSEKLPIDFHLFNDIFVITLSTLPAAIKKRNLLRVQEGEIDHFYSTDNDNYQNLASDDDDDDIFEEDIWFESSIDQFDVYSYIRKLLESPQPQTFGTLSISNMSEEQVSSINKVISIEQEQQK